VSQYASYDRLAGHYDTTRSAISAEIWLGQLLAGCAGLDRLQILDAGCGTGNYTLALAPHVARVTGIDMNARMLAEAGRKAEASALADKVSFRRGELPDLPFADASFDAVMFNQVLHHLEPPGTQDFARHARAIAEAARVLRPGGLVLINACSPRQVREAFWYYALIPEACRQVCARMIGTDTLKAALHAAGFAEISRTVPLEALLQGPAGLDPHGPLDPAWRAGDSGWVLASEAELSAALARIEEMDRAGTLAEFVAEHDRPRHDIGQTTFWCAVKAG